MAPCPAASVGPSSVWGKRLPLVASRTRKREGTVTKFGVPASAASAIISTAPGTGDGASWDPIRHQPAVIDPIEQGTLAIALLRHMRARRENVLSFQRQRLQTLIRHAASRVPYYRRLLASHGISPDDVRTAADLLALPITSKHDLHAQPVGDVLAAGVNPSALLMRTTGGSTGMPLVVRRTAAEERLLSVARRRLSRYFGYGLRDRLVVVSAPGPHDAVSSFSWMRRPLRFFGILDVQHVSCFLPPADIAAELARRQPAVLGGYPSVLARVGQHLLEEGSTAIRPRVVLTGGEVRTAHMRDQIRASFRTETCDTYGSHEFNRIAYECRQTGAYHVCDDTVIVEVVDQNGHPVREGERGEVVGTGLFSLAMPFIRYRLGDVVVKGRDGGCECGAPFSTIRSIQGRTVDYFPLPDGRLLHRSRQRCRNPAASNALSPGSANTAMCRTASIASCSSSCRSRSRPRPKWKRSIARYGKCWGRR
jgi:phenylacetate-CoA ligase